MPRLIYATGMPAEILGIEGKQGRPRVNRSGGLPQLGNFPLPFRRLAYRLRRRGSRASRRESPKRLKAKTARLMARPGKMAIQGAVSANSTAAPRSINPHAAVGS